MHVWMWPYGTSPQIYAKRRLCIQASFSLSFCNLVERGIFDEITNILEGHMLYSLKTDWSVSNKPLLIVKMYHGLII